ncbi:MAG: thioredoxin family protein [Campylobacterota bacterium]|nr:thioredoxin family protein [Campylobacterota bacterium]
MKLYVLLCLCLGFIYASDGKDIYEKKCASCHKGYISMDALKKNYLDYNNTLLKLAAPTINQLSYRLKQRIGDPKGDNDMHRMEVSAFISDYVYYPDRDKSVCLPDVMQHFKTMPSLKGKISEEELEEVNMFIYEYDEKIVKQKSVKYEGFDEALKRAKKEHKIIMIKAMTDDCHYCRKMEREVMIEKDVTDVLNKDFITVMVDVSKMKLPLGLKSEVTPTFVFVDEESNVLMHIPGAWNKTDFLLLLEEAKQKKLTTKDKK